jgi:2-polyprenyl-3-methyl-5-hydroxy-6-metoxy-1,4-benzoquinol methylase
MLHVLTNRRSVTDEIMDSPDVDELAHLQALEGLRRINRVSRTAGRMLQPILEFTRRSGLKRISILDVACGGGDVPIGLALEAQNHGLHVDLTLLDRSGTAIRQAATAAAQAGIQCRCIQTDALAESPSVKADVVTSSLFLHHVHQPRDVIEFLRRLSSVAERLLVISDLRRSRWGLAAAWAACRALSRSRIVHHDGPASVRAAWTVQEMSSFAQQAGLTGARIRRCAPWRMLLVWERP